MNTFFKIFSLWKTWIFIISIIAVFSIFIFLLFWYKHIDSTERTSFPKYNETELIKIESAKNCFLSKANISELALLDDVLESDVKPQLDKSIFFHVTTCSNNRAIRLTARQACAIESASKWNPNREIFVLFAAPVEHISNETNSPIINALQLYPNIRFRNVNPITYSIGTPGQDWIKTNPIFRSNHHETHLSEYLRFLTLYKFGGIHIDLDMIILENFDHMPSNFVGAESNNHTNIGAIGFESHRLGHRIIEMVLREYMETYDSNDQAEKGAKVLTHVLMKICRRNHIADLLPNYCWGFKVYPPNAFYPIASRAWKLYFDTDPVIVYQTLGIVNSSIAVRLWNKYSASEVINKFKEETTYGILAERNCPNVFKSSGFIF